MAGMASFGLPIPTECASGLGHVMSAWASFEFELHRATCHITKVGLKPGRQLFPRISDFRKHFDLLRTLARLNQIELPEEFELLKSDRTYQLELRRNWLAHAVWSPPNDDRQSWGIRIASGDITQLASLKDEKIDWTGVRPAKEEPKIIAVTPSDLVSIATSIHEIVRIAKDMADKLEPSRKTTILADRPA
ncbi:MAG: hypothetical protein JNK21_14590 [Rhodospirillaceae bacterium]|nr:hypothetical protein [Rhodospirillaceae bacterium]